MSELKKSQKQAFETLALHAGQNVDPTTKSRAVPIYQTTSYVFDDSAHAARLFALQEFGNIYTRLMNPTTDVLEQRVSALEGGSMAVATASGQAAQQLAITTICEAGDHIVASASLYGGSFTQLKYTIPKSGIEVTFVDPSDPENFRKAIKPNTKLFYAETVGNPKLDTFDIETVANIGREVGIPLLIDNTFASPYLVNPFEYGAAVITHSLTKWIGGHGNSIGGIVVDGGNFDWGSGRHKGFTEPDGAYHGLKYWEVFGDFPGLGNVALAIKARVSGLRDQGQAISPFNSFLILQGIETLSVRLDRISENTLKIAKFLESHSLVNWVNYPGLDSNPSHELAQKYFHRGLFGGILGFGIKGGYDSAVKFIDSLEIFSLVANVGDARSLVIHPASTTHQQLNPEQQLAAGVTGDYIRLSIGLENIDDLIQALENGLQSSQI